MTKVGYLETTIVDASGIQVACDLGKVGVGQLGQGQESNHRQEELFPLRRIAIMVIPAEDKTVE